MPERVRGSAFGLAVMTGAVGGAITQPLVVWLLGVTTWRHCFEIFGLVGAVWATAWCWWFRDDPHHHASVNAAELEHIGSDAPTPHPPVPWAQVVRSRSLALLCLMYFGTIYGWYFYLTWLPSYLQRARGFDLKHAGWLSALPYLGIAAGVMAGGWLSDTLQRRWGARIGRRAPGLVGLPLAACAVLGAINTPTPILAAVLFGCAACLAALGVAAGWAMCLDIGGRHVGVVSGAMNMFGNLGGAVSPVVIGLCLKQWDSWNAPLYTVAAFYLVAAACWMGIDPSKTINNDKAV